MHPLRRQLAAVWTEQDGVLSFEWVLLLTLLVIGIVSGVAAARDALIDEFGDVAQGMLALDGSYTIDFPLVIEIDGEVTGLASDSGFFDSEQYIDCVRTGPIGQ